MDESPTLRAIKLVVNKTVGNIYPIGETRSDEKCYENLVDMIHLAGNLFTNIARVARYKNDRLASRAKIGKKAQCFLDNIKQELIDD